MNFHKLITRRALLTSLITSSSLMITSNTNALINRNTQKLREKMKIVIVTFNVKKENIDQFKGILDDVKINLPNVDGCLSVEIFQNASDKSIFTLIERWESVEKHQIHIQNLIEGGSWDAIKALLSSEPNSAYYSEY